MLERMDRAGQMRPGLIQALAGQGLLGAPLPVEYGGQGLDPLSLALIYEELGQADSSVRGFMTVHTSLVALTILAWGNEAQKAECLPRLARGEWVGCYCLTEPNAGSDAASLQTTARESGDEFVLNGEKIWITNGGIADIAVVFATLDPTAGRKGITAFLVPSNSAGFRRDKMPGEALGHRAADHAHIHFEECRVPRSALLGEVGSGFRVAMSALDRGRLGVAAGAVGLGQASLDASLAFARSRRQFGQRIGDFEMIQASLADMAAEVQAARLLVYQAAWLQGQGLPARRETSIAKLFAVEAAVKASSEAVLIHGGRGYSDEYPVERYFRDAKGLQIYEGTAHIQRLVIARDLLGKEPSA